MSLAWVAPLVAQGGAEPPPFRIMRYDEDFSAFADPDRRRDWLDDLKYLAYGEQPGDYLTLGGEWRARYEYFDSPGFGRRGVSHDDFLLQRLLLHADLHTGPRDGVHGRAFVQLLAGFVDFEELPKSAIQDNPLDLQQAFVEFGDGGRWMVRAGRQELLFGSARLVTPRDATNARLNFEAVRGSVGQASDVRFDALLARPVDARDGVFDDRADRDSLLWGLYSTWALLPAGSLGLDVYCFGTDRQAVRYDRQTGEDRRHSLGLRLFGRGGAWDHDTEAVLQFGDYAVVGRAKQDVLAWTLASHTGYTFAAAPMQPRLGLKLDVSSGDRDPGDGRMQTFDPLFPRLNYFSDAVLFAPANFFDVHPSLRLQLHRDWAFTWSSDLFFRQSRDDAVYGPNGPVVAGDASGSRFVGSTTSLLLEWRLGRRVDWTFNFVHFARGDVVQDAGGTDVEFFASWLTTRF